MKGTLILAEAATAAPRGMVNMLNAFIHGVQGKGPKFALRCVAVVQIVADMVDAGTHEFDVRGMDEDGAEFIPKFGGSFDVPQGGGRSQFIIGIAGSFQHPGSYVVALRVDNHELDSAAIEVKQLATESKEEQK